MRRALPRHRKEQSINCVDINKKKKKEKKKKQSVIGDGLASALYTTLQLLVVTNVKDVLEITAGWIQKSWRRCQVDDVDDAPCNIHLSTPLGAEGLGRRQSWLKTRDKPIESRAVVVGDSLHNKGGKIDSTADSGHVISFSASSPLFWRALFIYKHRTRKIDREPAARVVLGIAKRPPMNRLTGWWKIVQTGLCVFVQGRNSTPRPLSSPAPSFLSFCDFKRVPIPAMAFFYYAVR